VTERVLSLGVLHDAAGIRHLGRIVGASNFVVEQLASGISHQPDQLGSPAEQLAVPVELLDPPGQPSEELGQPVSPGIVIHFVVVGHAGGNDNMRAGVGGVTALLECGPEISVEPRGSPSQGATSVPLHQKVQSAYIRAEANPKTRGPKAVRRKVDEDE
jgi:hypothetical protein